MNSTMKYREVAPSYEATPSYRYDCLLCEELISGPRSIRSRYSYGEGYTAAGDRVVDVLHNGQTITVHERCNRS